MAWLTRDQLVAELREHALVIGEVTLTSGATAQYYVDAKRAILRPAGFAALGELVAAEARERGATAVGGLTMGADPVACSALAAGADVKAFFVRKERKAHGLQRWVEGPPLDPGSAAWWWRTWSPPAARPSRRSSASARRAWRSPAWCRVLDRLAGGGEAIERRRERPTGRWPPSTTCIRSAPTASRPRARRRSAVLEIE